MGKNSNIRLSIASPCNASWDEMKGNERVRFCAECDLNVYDLSETTEKEALRLVAEREERLCVRFYQREDGTILTKDCPVGEERRGRASLGGLPQCPPWEEVMRRRTTPFQLEEPGSDDRAAEMEASAKVIRAKHAEANPGQ